MATSPAEKNKPWLRVIDGDGGETQDEEKKEHPRSYPAIVGYCPWCNGPALTRSEVDGGCDDCLGVRYGRG